LKRGSVNAATPECAVNPVANLTHAVAKETRQVTNDFTIHYNGPRQKCLVGKLLCPMTIELPAVARTKCTHRHGDRVALVLEDQRQVRRFDIAELNVHRSQLITLCSLRYLL